MAGSGISACFGRFPFRERAGKTADSQKGKPTGRAGSCPAADGLRVKRELKRGCNGAGGAQEGPWGW